jgi:predicted nucleic-acid-binding Zn-ribbon protein
MSDAKKCPKCGGEMERGLLGGAAQLWAAKRRSLVLGGDANVFAYKCNKCDYIELYAEPR